MGSKKLLTPKFKVQIGKYLLESGITVECNSTTERRSSWAMVALDSQFKNLLELEDMQPAVIQLGYEGDYDTLLEGYIIRPTGSLWNEITIQDDTVLLYRQTITETFLDCTPQDIIRYGLRLAGITDMVLSEEKFAARKVFSVVRKNIMDLIDDVNKTWGIEAVYYFKGRQFYWGVNSNQKLYYVLREGVNITAIHKFVGEMEVETIGIPWIHQGELVRIEHTDYTGLVRVISTTARRNMQGFVRMYITFRSEENV